MWRTGRPHPTGSRASPRRQIGGDVTSNPAIYYPSTVYSAHLATGYALQYTTYGWVGGTSVVAPCVAQVTSGTMPSSSA